MRRDARESAFGVIVSHLFAKEPELGEAYSSLKKEDDIAFAKEICDKFLTNREALTKIIDENLEGYERSRVYKLDLALLYLSLTEILYIKTPYKVAINEACDIAKKFSTAKSSAFLNGVLSKVIKTLGI